MKPVCQKLLMSMIAVLSCAGMAIGQTTVTTAQDRTVGGIVTDESGAPIAGVTVHAKPLDKVVITDAGGKYSIDGVNAAASLEFSFIGFEPVTVSVGQRGVVNVTLMNFNEVIDDVVVVGYGTRKREAITGSVVSVGQSELSRVHGSTTSTLLAGKLPGMSFRQSDGRPGASAYLQIRNYGGDPLFVIDGVTMDKGAFDQLASTDIESISVLKDGAASIYGLRAANGVVLVTTRTGRENTPARVNLNLSHGWQNWTRFPTGVNAYEWQLAKAEGQVNTTNNGSFRGTPDVNAEELAKWRAGTEPGYRSFDWYDFIINENAPQTQTNINVSGGGANNKYYVSLSNLNQNAAFKDFNYNRTNIQSNIETSIGKRVKVGMNLSGRIDSKKNPAVLGADADDYWQPRNALLNLLPFERPYINDNPLYPARTQVPEANWGAIGYGNSGYHKYDLYVATANMFARYNFKNIEGLSVKYNYSYQLADVQEDNFEYKYNLYTLQEDEYVASPMSANTKRERYYKKVHNTMSLITLNYDYTFGDKHHVMAMVGNERSIYHTLTSHIAAQPNNNYLPLIMYNDMTGFTDTDAPQARIGYVVRASYDYLNKYYFEFSGRYDASWKFAPENRWSFFPSVSAGWRVSEEPFFKNNIAPSVMRDLKLRASYGVLGSDSFADSQGWYGAAAYSLGDYDYLRSYSNGSSIGVYDGEVVNGIRDRGMPPTQVSWLKSRVFNVGLDFSFINGSLSGSIDFFHRVRDGLLWPRNDLLLPSELGYTIAFENLNKDAVTGGEFALDYIARIGQVRLNIGANISYARNKTLSVYNEKMQRKNSLDEYRNSQSGRYQWVNWGYRTDGVFQSQEQINDWPVNVDGKGNVTLLPGDFIIEDVNGDGRIDTYDMRPISYMDNEVRPPMPIVNGGLTIGAEWKGLDFAADFSFVGGYAFTPNWETKWPFQNQRTIVKATQFDNRWRREDPYDINSAWIPGDVPALRWNARDYSSWNLKHDYWTTNVRAFRMRSVELGYSLPKRWTDIVSIEQLRVYVNGYNLFSIDNVKRYGVDAEISDRNGMQYPQNRVFNIGVNLTF